MPRKIGERIGAIRDANENVVHIFGFGTYQGEEVPPENVGGPLGRMGLFGHKNPKLEMDDGTIVWGCESWWGDEELVRKKIGTRQIEIVKPIRTPAPEEERAEAAEIIAQAEIIAKQLEERKTN